METLKTTGHYGDVLLGAVGPVGIVVFKKAPLKYYKELPVDNKDKRDVVFAYIDLEWKYIGAYSVDESPEKLEEINQAVSDMVGQ